MLNSDTDSLEFLLGQIIRLHRTRVVHLFGELGLNRGQPPILFMLWKQDGRTQKELAEGLMLTPATITNILQRMEKAGLLERQTDPEDLRISRVYLTEKGKMLRLQVEAALTTLEHECFQGFNLEETMLLRRFFLQIKDNLLAANGEKN